MVSKTLIAQFQTDRRRTFLHWSLPCQHTLVVPHQSKNDCRRWMHHFNGRTRNAHETTHADGGMCQHKIAAIKVYMMCRCPLSSCWYYDILWFHPLPSTQSYNRTITPMRILWYFSQPSVCCYAVPVDLLIVVLMETLSTSVSWMATCRSLSIVAATGVFTSFDPQIHDDLVNPPNHWYHPLYFYSTIFPC